MSFNDRVYLDSFTYRVTGNKRTKPFLELQGAFQSPEELKLFLMKAKNREAIERLMCLDELSTDPDKAVFKNCHIATANPRGARVYEKRLLNDTDNAYLPTVSCFFTRSGASFLNKSHYATLSVMGRMYTKPEMLVNRRSNNSSSTASTLTPASYFDVPLTFSPEAWKVLRLLNERDKTMVGVIAEMYPFPISKRLSSIAEVDPTYNLTLGVGIISNGVMLLNTGFNTLHICSIHNNTVYLIGSCVRRNGLITLKNLEAEAEVATPKEATASPDDEVTEEVVIEEDPGEPEPDEYPADLVYTRSYATTESVVTTGSAEAATTVSYGIPRAFPS